MTHVCRLIPLAVLIATAAAFGHPGHEVGNLDHLVESPDHWLPLVLTAALFGGIAVMAIKWWRDARASQRIPERARNVGQDIAE